MKKTLLLIACLLIAGFASTAAAQKSGNNNSTPAYKLTAINIMPFEKMSGALEEPITATDERSFFNEISKNYLVTVEVSGAEGSFATGRQIEIVVREGKKLKAKTLEQIDLIGAGGKVYMPLWINAPLCDVTTITARIVGQKTPATMTRKLTVFQCGE